MRIASGIAIVLAVLVISGAAQALPIVNPFPGVYGDDLDDSGVFNYADPVFSIEEFDLGAGLGLGGTRFGFYFASAPGTLIEIFDAADNGPGTSAVVNFGLGFVLDADDGYSLQDSFTPLAGPIGFWIEPSAVTGSIFGPGPLFSQASLNPGGVDHVSTLPSLVVPGALMLAFGGTDPATGADVPLSFEILVNLDPVFDLDPSATLVPEPASIGLFLLGAGMLGAAAVRRRRRRASH